MKTKTNKITRRVSGALCAVTTCILILAGTQPASAQWRDSDTQNAWSAFKSWFQYNSAGGYAFSKVDNDPGGVIVQDFWKSAELIEMAVDYYSKYGGQANKDEITGLCNGFLVDQSQNWSWNPYNDDINWACIAFLRAYAATGNSLYLTVAENNFNTVWTRGYDTVWGGGIWWRQSPKDYKNSPANWTFVIAGHLIYSYSGNGAALSRAQTVYSWCKSHLCDPSTGEIYDGYNANGPVAVEITYNDGTAIGAALYEGETSFLQKIAARVVSGQAYPIQFYAANGVPILTNYGQNGDGGGFNGILFRWLHVADVHNLLPNRTAYLNWAQTNVGQGWSMRNAYGLAWNDWAHRTPDPHVYNVWSFDCSSTLCGMLDVPTP